MKILFTHRYFWPDSPPYGVMLRSLAAAMAASGHQVAVFAGQPSYGSDVMHAPSAEDVDDVHIKRVRTFREDKNRPILRGLNVAIYCLRMFFGVLTSKAEVVTAASFPPVFAGWTASLACQLSGKKFVYHLQDIHPEVARVSGSFLGRGLAFKTLRWLDQQTMRRAASIVVLSDDMARTLMNRPKSPQPSKINIINNFEVASFSAEAPADDLPLKYEGVTRAIFAGNLGEFQNLELLINAARLVEEDCPGFEIFFLGEGAAERRLKRLATGLSNVSFHPYLPYAQARHVIADADAGLVSLAEGVVEVSYPSKTFTYLGLSVPLALIVEPQSELAKLVRSNDLGHIAAASTAEAVADMLRTIARSPIDDTARMAVKKFHVQRADSRHVFKAWSCLFEGLGAQ